MICEKCGKEFSDTVYPFHILRCEIEKKAEKKTDKSKIEKKAEKKTDKSKIEKKAEKKTE